MRFFLEKASEHMNKGLEFQSKGKLSKARYNYLKASEFLFKAADKSEGSLKEKRTRQAEQLLARAQTLDGAIDGKGESAGGTRKAAAAETEDGNQWLVSEKPRETFADVAGLENVKEQIRIKLIYPFTHPEKAKKYGKKAGGGILLYGPPGTGKTMIARASASEIDGAFFTVKPSEIMSKWVGEAEQNIDKLFQAARSHDRSVIFIDEVEALIPKRSRSGSTVMQRVVPQILAEMAGFKVGKGQILFMGATNEPWALDEAVLRPGRFDEKIYVPLPDTKARSKILEMNLKGRPLAEDLRLDEIVEATKGYSGADIFWICEKASNIPFVESVQTAEDRPIEMRDFLTALHEVRPSVTQRARDKFEKFQFS